MMMPNSVNSRIELKMVLLEQVRFQKKFPEVPIVVRVSSGQSRIAVERTSGARNIPGLVGNVGCSRAARCLRIVQISCVGQRVHLVLQILTLSQKLTHNRRMPLLLQR